MNTDHCPWYREMQTACFGGFEFSRCSSHRVIDVSKTENWTAVLLATQKEAYVPVVVCLLITHKTLAGFRKPFLMPSLRKSSACT